MAELWERTATRLGEQTAQEHFSELPVDPVALARKVGIQVEPLPSDEKTVSGMLVYSGNLFGIQYATYIDSPGFQNFCVAHELGHYFMPDHPEKLLSTGIHQSHAGFVSDDRCEQEADHFAAGFLMPSFLIDPVMNQVQNGLKAIERLAAECGTSLTATAIRYAQKTPDPVAVIMSEGTRILYAFMSDELREIRGLTWIKKGTPVPRDSVTYRFNQNDNNILSGATAENEASMSDWFGCSLPYELYEEVKGLGGYGKTLTVLSIDELPDQEEIEEEEDLQESWTPRFRR